MEREIIKGMTSGFEYTKYSIQEYGEYLRVYDNKTGRAYLFFRGIVEVETKGGSLRELRQYAVVGNDLKQMSYTSISDDFTIKEGSLENV